MVIELSSSTRWFVTLIAVTDSFQCSPIAWPTDESNVVCAGKFGP